MDVVMALIVIGLGLIFWRLSGLVEGRSEQQRNIAALVGEVRRLRELAEGGGR